MVKGKRDGSPGTNPRKITPENVFFEQGGLPFIDAVNYIVICSKQYIFQI